MSVELMPCPWAHLGGEHKQIIMHKGNFSYVQCNCGARSPGELDDKTAFVVWGARASGRSYGPLIARAVEILKRIDNESGLSLKDQEIIAKLQEAQKDNAWNHRTPAPATPDPRLEVKCDDVVTLIRTRLGDLNDDTNDAFYAGLRTEIDGIWFRDMKEILDDQQAEQARAEKAEKRLEVAVEALEEIWNWLGVPAAKEALAKIKGEE